VKVQEAAEALQAEHIPYDPVGKGANWALMEALRRCGMDAPLPPKRWVPGLRLLAVNPTVQNASTRAVGQSVVL
jgi:hypothetical protein